MTIRDLEKLLLAVAGAEESYRFRDPEDNEKSIYGGITTAAFKATFGVRRVNTPRAFRVELFTTDCAAEVEFPTTVTLAEAERCIGAMVRAFEVSYAAGSGEAVDD